MPNALPSFTIGKFFIFLQYLYILSVKLVPFGSPCYTQKIPIEIELLPTNSLTIDVNEDVS